MIGEPTNIFDHDDEAGTDVEFSWSALQSIAAAYSLPGDTRLRIFFQLKFINRNTSESILYLYKYEFCLCLYITASKKTSRSVGGEEVDPQTCKREHFFLCPWH